MSVGITRKRWKHATNMLFPSSYFDSVSKQILVQNPYNEKLLYASKIRLPLNRFVTGLAL